MKKKAVDNDEMRAEYDFSGGVRGKHFKKLQDGHTTIVHKFDGSRVVTATRLIALAPDVQPFFRDADSVNEALRGLIALVPGERGL